MTDGIALISSAAELGNAAALNNLGHCYETGKVGIEGRGQTYHLDRARELYAQSSSQGYMSAKANLGYLLLQKAQAEFDNFDATELNISLVQQAASLFLEVMNSDDTGPGDELFRINAAKYYGECELFLEWKRASIIQAGACN